MPSRITSDILKTANSFKDDDARMQYIRENAYNSGKRNDQYQF